MVDVVMVIDKRYWVCAGRMREYKHKYQVPLSV